MPTDTPQHDARQHDALLPHGDLCWLGRYRIVRRLGAGGMGVVYLAHDRDGTPVAIKLLHRHLCTDPALRRRFACEIAAAGRASGRGAPQLLAADPHTSHPYLITEFLPGPSLHDWVGACGPLTPAGTYGFAVGLARAVAAVHSTGVVHRDLKPANVILSPSGPRIIDFGAATAHSTAPRPASEVSFGTLAWMSPQQLAGQPLGPSSDVYTWGLLVFWAATGRTPAGPNGAPFPETDFHQLPQQVRPAVRAALQRDPAARPTAAQLVATLIRHTPAGHETSTQHAAGSRRAVAPPAAPTRRLPRRARSVGRRRLRPRRRVLATLLVAAVLVSAWALAGGNQGPPPAPGPPPPVAPAPPAGPALPAISDVNTVTDGALTFTLTGHRCGLTELRSGLLHTSADGQFCLLQIKIHNKARYPAWAVPASQHLIDDAGHQHTANTTAWIYHPPARALLKPVTPDATITGTLVFDIPADATPSLLLVHDTPLSRGTPMPL